jgi:3-oxoadipate enol-lactonase
MLLHGWLASADLNWWGAYDALVQAGYRVLAIDHRGHGRGLRSILPFRLSDCAADVAAALDLLDAAPADVVGYSMGGAIAQLLARDHPEVVSGVVLAATAHDWSAPRERWFFRGMGALWLSLALAPNRLWREALRRERMHNEELVSWMISELLRASARDLAEAGRELGRFDSRPWIASLAAPSAVVVTTRDTVVSPRKQRSLAAMLGARILEAPIDHLEIVGRTFNAPLLAALEAVAAQESLPAQRASMRAAGGG